MSIITFSDIRITSIKLFVNKVNYSKNELFLLVEYINSYSQGCVINVLSMI